MTDDREQHLSSDGRAGTLTGLERVVGLYCHGSFLVAFCHPPSVINFTPVTGGIAKVPSHKRIVAHPGSSDTVAGSSR